MREKESREGEKGREKKQKEKGGGKINKSPISYGYLLQLQLKKRIQQNLPIPNSLCYT